MSTNVTVDREGTVTGNTFDKYGSTNPVVRRLMAGFHSSLDELWDGAAPNSILDVGCGEGVLTYEWAQKLDGGRIVGIDLDDPQLHAQWQTRSAPNLEYQVMKAESLPFADREFDMATAIEVLEHVPDPRPRRSPRWPAARSAGCSSRCRASRSGAPSTSRAAPTGRSLGNTPGHVNHWSKRSFTTDALRATAR